jgi:hypothetical protein
MASKQALGALLVLSACLCGCGYSVGSLMRDDVASVSVEMFANDTFYRNIEVELTRAVVTRIEKETPYRIADSQRADAVMEGRILAYAAEVLQEDAQNRPTESEIAITAEVKLVNPRSGSTLYSGVIRDGESFSTFSGETEQSARVLLYRRMAQTIVEKAFERDW